MKIVLQKLLLIFACISPFIPISALQAQTDSLGALYQRNFMQQRAKYPQEQAVLLTDKPCYYVGDSVRYRVHLLNRGLGRTDSLSRNFYIELRDRGGNLISGQMLDLFSPVQFGAMPLPDTLITGNYLLIAYTLWMRNFSDRAVTVLPIFVRHRAPDTLLRSKIAHLKGEVKAFDRLAKKLRINWGSDDFPTLRLRSGFWVSVRNLQDKAVPAVLSLYEGKALVQTTIANGYGLAFVRYNTKADTKYKLVATYRNWKKTAKWKSPKAAGYSTDMLVNDGKLSLYFRNEGMPTADRVARTKHIVLQANGKLVQWQTTVADTVVISLTNLPYSSLKCSVLGGAGQVIGEWPVYNSGAKSLGFSLKRELTSESLALRIATTGGEKQAQEFTLSIRAKTEADKLAPKVWVVNPLKSVHDLAPDSVMLVREMLASSADLSWPELFSGQKIALRYPHEKAIEISGQIVKTYLNLPYPGVRVMLSNLLSHNQNYETISGLGGRFRFSNLYFADSAHIYIEVLSDRDNHVGLVNIDTLSNVSTGRFVDPGIGLAEIEAWGNGRRERFSVKDDGHPRLHERPSKGKDFKENELTYYQTVFDMLRVFPGVMVSGSRVSLRGAGEPLAVIDGMETSVSALESINPHDVVRIEIVDSPASLIYGRKGINGAVVVFTKQGHHIIRGKLDFAMAGYLTPPLTKNVYRNFAPKENDLLMWHPQIFTNTQGETRVDLPLELANVPLLVEITALDGLGNFRRFSFEVNVGD